MDVLRALSSPSLDIRKKTLDLSLELLTPRNIDEVGREGGGHSPGREEAMAVNRARVPCGGAWLTKRRLWRRT